MEKIKIFYLTGYGKSGATLIGRHLGNSEQAYFVGELKYFWNRGLVKNYALENFYLFCIRIM